MPVFAWCIFLIFLLGEGMVCEIGEVREKGRERERERGSA